MSPKIDIFALLPDTFDADAFADEIIRARPNSLIYMGHYVKSGPDSPLVFKGYYRHQPPGVNITWEPFSSRSVPMSDRLRYLLLPVLSLMLISRLFVFCLWLGFKYRVQTVALWNEFMCAIFGVLRRLGLFKRVVFFSGDWLQGSALRTGMWSYINKEMFFPAVDWICCRMSDMTIHASEAIPEARDRYWGRKITRAELPYEPPLMVKCMEGSEEKPRKKILFLGGLRGDSGMDLVLSALPALRERLGDVSVKIVGPTTQSVVELEKKAVVLGLGELVECTGPADRQSFDSLFSDCFCGVNVITNLDSHSSKGLPAKVMDYFQYLLPVLVTVGVGRVVDSIREHELGLVVEPDIDAVTAALICLYEKRADYVDNLRLFIKTRPHTNLVKILDPEAEATA